MDRHSKYTVRMKTKINRAFEALDIGTFAAWEALPATLPAGLYVDEVGDIDMPLSEGQARRLIAVAHQAAPADSASSMLVDGESSGHPWQINADRLEFLEPAWQGYLLRLSDLVAAKLGVDGPIRVRLDKMLIYEPGGRSEPQTDLERTKGMFGTLMICLPSAHKGGEVLAKHKGGSVVLGNSDATPSFSCWYSDVSHEVLPVQSGYRCVLIYNLAIKPGSTRPTASSLHDLKEAPLRNTLECWLKDLADNKMSDVPSRLYQTIDHEDAQPEASGPILPLEALKAQDSTRLHALREFAHELPFEIFLALLENADPHDLFRDDHTMWTVKSLSALDGVTIASNYKFDSNSCLLDDPLDDMVFSEDSYAAYGTHPVRRWAIAIIAHEKIGEFLAECTFGSPEDDRKLRSPYDHSGSRVTDKEYKSESSGLRDYESALRYLGGIRSIPSGSARTTMLDAICKMCKTKRSQRLHMTNILTSALMYSHFTLFQTVGTSHRDRLPSSFFDWAKQWLTKLSVSERTEKYQTWIPLLIQGYSSMTVIMNIIQQMSNPTGDAAVPGEPPFCHRTWAQGVKRRCITNFHKTTKKPTISDAKLIVTAIFDLNGEWEDKSALLVSIVDHFPQCDATAFLLAVLYEVKTQSLEARLPISPTVELYGSLGSRVFNPNRKLSNILTKAKMENDLRWYDGFFASDSSGWGSDHGQTLSPDTGLIVTSDALVRFAFDANEANAIDPFIEELIEQCTTFSVEDMRDLWMPFLYGLIRALTLAHPPVSLEKLIYQQLTSRFIKHFIDKALGSCPQAQAVVPPTFQVACPCGDCIEVNNFLRNVNQRATEYRLIQSRRNHIAGELNRARVPCTFRTIQYGRPYTLGITKANTSADDIREWKELQSKLYTTLIQKIGLKCLESLLGTGEAARVKMLATPI
ncbi:hypothetical protein MJO28_000283 [Puccinia striiformis f. sp. tritici]|uniref:Prolyl 4-hydroxylase alpha subunit Fe(2+) 2OG dioxygenase domain-containing protein n=3 Tax=Puccinia striiformis f. sp. tritici TaxID=168172 RepID=A0A0L0VYU3_9BASI|nr:hypothetical protein MJO28_000283 [Puccinia striiformis f. sp. tritici]KNF04175.1 hypothetical protein PSTG_02526 [Puccinia striiformis f. sp. tritici PST-78]